MKENSLEDKEKEKLGLDKLPIILDYLKSLGMEIAVHDIEQAKNYLIEIGDSLPLVRDGVDGVRASYHKRKDSLSIWFTNGFEKPNNEMRIKIENWMNDNFEKVDLF